MEDASPPTAEVLGLELLVLAASANYSAGSSIANYSTMVLPGMTRDYEQRIFNQSWNRLVFLDLLVRLYPNPNPNLNPDHSLILTPTLTQTRALTITPS